MDHSAKIVSISETRAARQRPAAAAGLLIGDRRLASDLAALRPDLAGLRALPFADLDAELLARLAPPLVVAELLSRDHDCIDLAQMMDASGLETRLCLLSSGLPCPDLVRRELAAAFPRLDLELWPLPGPAQSGRSPSR
ncbi:hypothetical protein [Poseidonocella sp. HB161398]|uniref:hypothetical protein n=1 Tax=Poseidonocella sp. HB161398 TaxID=2320855 RepID=UPI00110850F4|nr:hypothetical protein [Poseidonocella sp. HB161398]